MPRPRNIVDLQDLLDGPAEPGAKSQKRTNRFYKNDISKLVSDIHLDNDDNAQSQPKNNRNRGGDGGGSMKPKAHQHPRTARASTSQSVHSMQTEHQNRKSKTQQRAGSSKTNKSHHSNRQLEPLKPLNSAEHTNVTCRFVVRSDASLSANSINVDKPIPSKQLWRVFSPAQDCPICLEKAEVPRMLGCGHVMCFHCMIKHRKYSESPDICPICGEVVSLIPSRSLPVSFLEIEPEFLPKEDDEVVLTLMSRPANSAVALPVNLELQNLQRRNAFPNPDLILWTRLCRGTLDYAKQEMAAEVKYLIGASKQCISEFGSDEEGYDEAASDLKRYIHSLNVLSNPTGNTSSSPELSTGDGANHSSSGASSNSDTVASTNANSEDNKSALNEFVYYYQTSFESPMVYTLSALDVSILKAAFGSFDQFPSSLITRIQNIEYGILDRTNDKRMKFLSHLPEQTPVAFLDCDWTDVIDPEVLQKFKSKLDERNRNKRRKMAKDVAERQRAHDAIEEQFKVEVAEALLPHEGMSSESVGANIDTAQLPSLKKPKPTSNNDQQAEEANRRIWVDHRKEYEDLMRHAYVPKKGRKDIILRF